MPNLHHTKKILHQYCEQRIQEQVHRIEIALASMEESRNNETKSSVGDKYETGRAMMQQEVEKYRVQLSVALHTRNILHRIDPGVVKEKVELGSLVVTDAGAYFLAVGIGKIRVEDELFFAISIDSPIGRALLQKQKGDCIHFNQKAITILDNC